MPEYTYDPGQDVGDVDFTYEQREANTLSKAAADYSRRNEYVPDAGDLNLLELQAQLARETHPLKQQQLAARVQSLAERSVRGTRPPQAREIQTYDPSEVNGSKSVMSTPYGQMQAEYGRDVIEENLTWASNYLEDSTIDTLNQSLHSDDVETVRKAFRVLQAMKENNITDIREITGGKK